ncbi:FAD binding domain-containing protein [Mycena epipterygia]|nr:FAD binding domain-containing protein [Mycena epipterygia]
MTTNPPTCKTMSDFFPVELDIEDLYALTIRQGLVEKILSDATAAICGVEVIRPWAVVDTRLDSKDPSNGPVVVTLKSQYGEVREVKARYVVGCDGGRSNVRRSLNKYDVKLQGDAHDSVWSAMDIVGFKTDFPDFNKVAIVASAQGHIMIIPREDINGMNCLRFYIEVDRGRTPSLEDVIGTVHKVFHPFTFSWEEINWFTIYPVAQRIASVFDVKERIFLAGDAAHLHSPKGALGMNTSLMDAHNLALKIALVEKGIAKPTILSTYALERRHVATHLVAMDAELIQIYADHGKSSDPADNQKLVAFQQEHFAFQAGTNITYAPNVMVDTVSHAPSAMAKLVGGEGLIVGRRLLPAPATRYSDGETHCAPGWRHALHPAQRPFSGLSGSPLRPISPDAPALLHGRLGLRTASAVVPSAPAPVLFDTSALYSDDVPCLSPYVKHTDPLSTTTFPDVLSIKAAAGILLHPVHQKWDVDIESGGLVIVRPDGHVGSLTRKIDADAWMKVEKYFEGFLVL